MSTLEGSSDTASMPPEDSRFPFPSLAFAGRRTIAPGELAARLTVPETHIEALVANGHLETSRRFVVGGERWIAVEPMKKFIRSRVCGPIFDVPLFLQPVPYGCMLECHQAMAAAVGDTWVYPQINRRMLKWPDFVPSSMAIIGAAALPLTEASILLRCDEEVLIQRIESYRLPGAIDLRLGEGGPQVHRVPVEAYRFWLRTLFVQKTDCLLLAQSSTVVRELYLELGAFLGGKLATAQ